MSRGQGRVFHPSWTDPATGKLKVALHKWALDYSLDGTRHREATPCTSKTAAQRLLRQRIGERETGKVTGRPDRVVLAEYVKGDAGTMRLVGGLRWLHETQFDLDGRRSKRRIAQHWRHLEAFFGAGTRALQLTASRLDAYAAARLATGAARQTVNNELASLRRAFKLAVEKGLLAVMPLIKLPAVRNARSGFFEEGDFAALLMELPAYVRAVVRFLRLTGWRLGEARGLTWDALDWDDQAPDGAERLDPGPNACLRLAARATKGGDERVFPFGQAPELQQLLAERWAERRGVYVFHREGQRLGNFRGVWRSACKRAGLAGRLVHDLRRSFARDMRRAGVSEGEIMRLAGWRTRSMFDRYNIIDEADLARAVAKRFANGQVTAKWEGTAAPAERLSSSPI